MKRRFAFYEVDWFIDLNLERAAEIADGHASETLCTEACYYVGEKENCAAEIAKAIRALKGE